MAINENLINIPGRLHSIATEGHVAGADEIYDDTETKLQSIINSEIRTEIGTDSTSGSIKGRVKTLEDAVGTGGSVDTRIAAAVSEEETRAKGVESTLDGKIATEKTRAEAAELANSTAITNEVSRAQNAEAALGNRITPLEEEVGTGGTIDQRIENATKNAAYIDASDEGFETVNW